jgi:CreA protein
VKRTALALGILLAVFALVVLAMLLAGVDFRDRPSIGEVDTRWTLLGSDYKVAVDVFEDPKVEGVACFISRPRTGGITGSLGLREDPSDASISCRQVGPIRFREPIEDGERVFAERRSLVFKTLSVVRFYDPERRTLVYLSYTTRVIEGSPKNALSAVPLMPWGGAPAQVPPNAAR